MDMTEGDSRPPHSAEQLVRLAQIGQQYHDRWKLFNEIQSWLKEIKQVGIWVVDGEEELRDELDGLIKKAEQSFEQFLRTPDDSILTQLEKILRDGAWELGKQILRDLPRKADEQQVKSNKYRDRLRVWEDRVKELRESGERALRVQAPVLRSMNEVKLLEVQWSQASRDLKERNYVDLHQDLRHLDDQDQHYKQLAADFASAEEYARKSNRHAELLLLRSPAAKGRVQYTVLLRTPSEPGTHGVNIESSSTLVVQDSDELRDFLKRVTEAINAGLTLTRSVLPESRDARGSVDPQGVNKLIQDMGELLYRLVIPEQMQPYLSDENIALTITTNDLEIPWELMHVDGQFICLRHPVARMPMGHAVPRKPRLRDKDEKFRFILIYADPTKNLPMAAAEVEKIEKSLKEEWKERIEIDRLDSKDCHGRKMNELLRRGQYDVIHYAGHAGFDEDNGDLSYLLLHNKEECFAQKIRRLLEGRPLVFLNACESASTANEREMQKIDRCLQGPAVGLASSFIYGGAVGCIGSIWPVYDDAAAAFAVTLYGRILEGYSIGQAMQHARAASLKNLPNQITWGTFVLYGDPSFRFIVPDSGRIAKPQV